MIGRRALLAALAASSVLTACAATPAPPVPKAVPPADRPDGDGGVSAFYQPPATVPAGPGHMLRTEAITGATLPPAAGGAERILYTSTSGVGAGTQTVVSGQIILPKGMPPAGGWPIVSWEHGTTGVADVCAPSWRGYFSRDRAYLDRWLSAGFAVVASDYQGLGTPGPHPYLLYRPEGYSALDALRAALAHDRGLLSNRIILVGQSQGGGAALGAAWLAPRYAPELHILGTVATGVVTAFGIGPHPAHPPVPRSTTESATMSASFAILTTEGSEKSLHPGTDVDADLTPRGRDLAVQARRSCLGDLFKYTTREKLGETEAFVGGHARFDPERIADFRIPDAHLTMPVFVGTGMADGEAGVTQQYNAVAAMCDAGTNVTWKEYPGLTHNGAVNVSAGESVPFALALLHGKPVRSNCATIRPLTAVQAPAPGIRWNN
ncbi:hypothetical protein AA12717_2518 [Gluconacetobacter sacchari DSM 12717]|uniref:Lipase n=2 Tax=Gluconacetobacter sacchari TaxID=92759 RepID=A0A7W4NLE9_9PROT|nr:lipase family protein [Gluconacetobacter sacchari]MBB2159897.1 lipase [Gluconacetobacter sacchari]GBQ26967.1 hypothetical protein AA12717_2518 [Gluconacetobacter sacchari DSM 12717]